MNEIKSGKAGQTPYFEDEAMNEVNLENLGKHHILRTKR